MPNRLKTVITAIALSSFVAAPVFVATTVVSTEAAYAKNDNGNKGGGNGKSDSRGNQGKAKNDKTLKTKGSSSAKKRSSGKIKLFSNSKNNGKGLLGLFKKDKPVRSARKSKVTETSTSTELHPSKLGKLNGAINSSPNAKLAHIRNGNFNGPVGLAAALAVADHKAGEVDQATIDAANDVLNFDQAAAGSGIGRCN